jgi:hypothetical protein
MRDSENLPLRGQQPGGTILGGAASGLSYEGVLHDALAREDALWKRRPATRPALVRKPGVPQRQREAVA